MNLKEKNCGFTLLELIVVIVILGVLVGLAFPQYEIVVEKARSVEGIRMLGAIRKAQQSHYLMTSGTYSDDLEDLVIEIPAMKYFENTRAFDGNDATKTIGSAWRSDGSYGLSIDSEGEISCGTILFISDGITICDRLGY